MEALLNNQGIAARYDAETQLLTFPLPAGERLRYPSNSCLKADFKSMLGRSSRMNLNPADRISDIPVHSPIPYTEPSTGCAQQ